MGKWKREVRRQWKAGAWRNRRTEASDDMMKYTQDVRVEAFRTPPNFLSEGAALLGTVKPLEPQRLVPSAPGEAEQLSRS